MAAASLHQALMNRLAGALLIVSLIPSVATCQSFDRQWQKKSDTVRELFWRSKYEACEQATLELMRFSVSAFGPISNPHALALEQYAQLLIKTGRSYLGDSALSAASDILDRLPEGAPRMDRRSLTSHRMAARLAREDYSEALGVALELVDDYQTKGDTLIENYAFALGSLAACYGHLRQHVKSIETQRKVLDLWERVLKDRDDDYAFCLLNLATSYINADRYDEAEPLLLKAEAHMAKHAYKHSDWALLPNSRLAVLYSYQKRYAAALPRAERALAGYLAIQPDSLSYSVTHHLRMRGRLRLHLGQMAEAGADLQGAERLIRRLDGGLSTEYASICGQLNSYYRQANRLDLALHYVKLAFSTQQQLAKPNSAGLTESDRIQYDRKLATFFNQWALLVSSAFATDADELEALFTATLYLKGQQLNTSRYLRSLILQSGRTDARAALDDWLAARERLAYLNGNSRRKLAELQVDRVQVEQQVSQLERRLSDDPRIRAALIEKPSPGWDELRAALPPRSAAIEMLRVERESSTDTVSYLALVLNPTMQHPLLVSLPMTRAEERALLSRYFRATQKLDWDSSLTHRLWRPLANVLSRSGIDTVFFSPAGLYNQINLAAFTTSPGGQLLAEQYRWTQLNSTRDLLSRTLHKQTRTSQAVVFGRPSYTLEAAAYAQQPGRARSGDLIALESHTWTDLPGTENEARAIGQLLESAGVRTQLRLGPDATEAALKQAHRPDILHIATHGFYLLDTRYRMGRTTRVDDISMLHTDPLLRTGLILAGVSNAAQDPSAPEDGILTAYEAQNLDLRETKLVTLSACETGLGDAVAAEGVFGLPRAFQLAGAQAVLSTLWRVDDTATQMLMSLFYEHWTRGASKAEALIRAQLTVRKLYPEPRYWAGFVLIGE